LKQSDLIILPAFKPAVFVDTKGKASAVDDGIVFLKKRKR